MRGGAFKDGGVSVTVRGKICDDFSHAHEAHPYPTCLWFVFYETCLCSMEVISVQRENAQKAKTIE